MPYVCRNKTVYFNGEEKGVVQDFLVIRKEITEAKEEAKKLFEDENFPVNDSSLYTSKTPEEKFVWKRPKEIAKDPCFIVDGTSRFDIKQGGLGDCWMLAGMANLTTYERLWSFVVPNKQSFGDDYAGVFHFRFWRQGRWIDVVIDDRLPTLHGKLAFVSSTVGNEFWSALLEKAYAKMFGSYEAIEGGETVESMIDLSGGVPEVYVLKDYQNKKHLFDILHKAHLQQAWLTCSIDGYEKSEDSLKLQKQYGLVAGHAYTLTAIRRVKFDDKEPKQKLVRVRNPWGEETEWTGAYKDKGPEWKHISEEDRKKLNLEFKHDGEYWIHFRDFVKHFSNVEICHLSRDIFNDVPNEFDKKYMVTVHHSSWSIKDGTAGGNLEHTDTFKKNPQYRITLKDTDVCWDEEEDDDDDDGGEDKTEEKCTVIISLMQKNRRKGRLEPHTIGFYVYHIPDPEKWPKDKLQNRFLGSHAPVYETNFQGYYREVSARLRLKPGTYLIVPSTDAPDLEAEFMIRILTEKPADCLSLLLDEILSYLFLRCARFPSPSFEDFFMRSVVNFR